ncbi:FKBP-type peptidyl-prolyl cis-trans isomerase [Mucilaginibacter hurinus]|nr:FKBP-type peptidyl-prolyl cis-trans isomerase [Mucilaginibacter hurinus]
MKRYLVALLVVGFSACKKDSNVTQEQRNKMDDAIVEAYITQNNIVAQKDSASGLYFRIIESGNSTKPLISSNVIVKYIGYRMDTGSKFAEASTGQTLHLGGLIKGWQIGLQKIGEGGMIDLFIPSYLAYGNMPYGGLPPNSNLYYRVHILTVEN